MPLPPGSRLGPYEITAPLGAGGMGEVYRANDTRLGREVAVKVLPSELAGNAQMRARFEREARVISSLNHPHICTLYDVGREADSDYLVMELLDGESLADRLSRGALPLDQALRYAIEIADALDKAHRAGVVHRDLKPGNIVITKKGAKLLDFGLAKSGVTSGVISPDSATVQMTAKPLTAEGTIVGTFQYMAPEQIESGNVDARSDLFAFGAVLYEMVTGRRAFDGRTRASVIAQILGSEPPPISSVQPVAPRALERIVGACLQKDPDERFQSAHDLLLELRWLRDEPASAAPAQTRRGAWRERIAWSLLALTIAAAIAIGAWHRAREARRPLVRAELVPPEGGRFQVRGDYGGGVVLSPDGSRFMTIGLINNARRFVFVRDIRGGETHPVPGTDGARFPFWSPDGASIGFFADAKLKTIPLAGGQATTLADVAEPRGGAWSPDGTIVFAATSRDGLFKIAAEGGTATRLTQPDLKLHSTHRWPQIIDGGRSVLYLAANHGDPSGPRTGLYVVPLAGGTPRRIVGTTGSGTLVGDDLFYVRGDVLVAQHFDGNAVSGKARPIVSPVAVDLSIWRSLFDAAPNGVLAYQAGTSRGESELVSYSRNGESVPLLSNEYFEDPSISPDGTKLAFCVGNPNGNLWLYDLVRGARTRFTFESGRDFAATWSHDSRWIYYSARAFGPGAIYRKPASGNGARELILAESPVELIPTDISADDRTLLYVRFPPSSVTEMWLLDLTTRARRKLLDAAGTTAGASFSRDGRYVAYTSAESGREEVYVVNVPVPSAKWQISSGGGIHARWSADGREIFYISPEQKLVSVAVTETNGQLDFGAPRELFHVSLAQTVGMSYSVAPDGKRIIVNANIGSGAPVTLVNDWRALAR
ncbi:MAG TPA: protein kinase [Thermoanaerobaculia bacterium]|jgi:hypothetical protein